MKIGYFGEPGAYTHIAAKQIAMGEYIPIESVRAVFMALENKNIDLAVVPVENSIEGAVNQTYDFLFRMNFYITKEYYLRIKHCLIGHPDAKTGKIIYVHSHPQALSQCSDFIYNHGMKPISEYDTAGSVQIIKENYDSSHAAIASDIAAELNGMKILEKDIENNRHNYTRFFLIGKTPVNAVMPSKTSIVFATQNKPGTLYKILKILNNYGINMTKIESRPVQYSPFQYIFFIDIENNTNTDAAIMNIRTESDQFKVLGTYETATINEY